MHLKKNTNEEVKYLKSLLHEAVEYVLLEKFLRWTHEGKTPRLDEDSDALVAEIKNQFTEEEWLEAKQTLYKKYSPVKKDGH